MESMSINKFDEIRIMCKYGLNVEEMFVSQLIYLAKQGNEETLVEYYTNKLNEKPLLEMLSLLKNKHVFTAEYEIPLPGTQFNKKNVIFNKNFLNDFDKASNKLGEELIQMYPHFITIKDMTYSLINYAKKFNSLEDFCNAYGKAIGWKVSKHNEIIGLIDWAKNNTNFINKNIADFVINNEWVRLKELKDGEFDGLSFNYIESI